MSEAKVEVLAEMTASVWQVKVATGQSVAEGEEIIILESMKMEIPVEAPSAGIVAEIHVAPEDQVAEGAVLVTLR
jgi:biotin carboxyl carrier protein